MESNFLVEKLTTLINLGNCPDETGYGWQSKIAV